MSGGKLRGCDTHSFVFTNASFLINCVCGIGGKSLARRDVGSKFGLLFEIIFKGCLKNPQSFVGLKGPLT